MNAFAHFLRFGLVNLPDNNLSPVSTLHAIMPVVGGDVLRWLVPVADLAAIGNVDYLQIGMRPRKSTQTVLGTLCGKVRRQTAEYYTEIRLRIGSAPAEGDYRQFSIMLNDTPILGTFRSQYSDLDKYMDALVKHYEAYTGAVVLADRRGREIRLKVYPNQRFRLSGEPLSVGIGTVTAKNDNTPTLTLQKKEVSLPAQDIYTVVVGADIAAGNIYSLSGFNYTASGSEKPQDILNALGVKSGILTVNAGASVVLNAQTGRQIVDNTNRPALNLLYDSTSGGNDYYKAVVSPDVQPGNVYSVGSTGSATRSYTATATDTKASVETYFNNVSGKVQLPAGSGPRVSVSAGVLSVANANTPTLGFSAKQSLPARSVDRYTGYVGSSVAAGNDYTLTIGSVTRTYRALAGDTALGVAGGLGYGSNPFSIDLSTGTVVQAYARKGPKYGSGNVADVTLLDCRTVKNIDRIAEVVIPTNLTPGEYQLTLSDSRPNTTNYHPIFALSNALWLQASTRDTVMLRYGPGEAGSVFGYRYGEDGLTQQVRVGGYVDAARLKQEESLSKTLDNLTVRGRTRAWLTRKLTTDSLQPESFHVAMYQALKHPVLYVDGVAMRCEGDYRQSEPQGRKRGMQADAELTEVAGLDYVPDETNAVNSESGSYALIEDMTGLEGLWLSVKRLTFVEPLSVGAMLPAADYDILISAGSEILHLTVGVNGLQVATFLVPPGVVTRLGPVRFAPGSISLRASVAAGTLVTNWAGEVYNPQDIDGQGTVPETESVPGDFNKDYNGDYAKR